MTDRDELIEQARKISALGRNVPFPNAEDTRIAKAFVDAGWRPPPQQTDGGGPLSTHILSCGCCGCCDCACDCPDLCPCTCGCIEEDDPWGGASLAKCGDEACRCSREPTDD